MSITIMNRRFALFPILMLLGACNMTVEKERYYWGSYENLLYKMYITPGEASGAEQIDNLERDILQAGDRAVPPGLFAHLGFLYAAEGNIAKAEESLNIEKELYPESRVLIDGMLERAATQQK